MPGAQTLCPQTRSYVNGVYYYGALDASNGCANSSFTSGNYYGVPVGCTSPYTGCIRVIRSAAPPVMTKKLTTTIPHHVQGLKSDPPSHPRISGPLDPNQITFEDVDGVWSTPWTHACKVKLSSSDSRQVLLMKLQSYDSRTGKTFTFPVGQEFSGSGDADPRSPAAYYSDEHYCTVDYDDGVTYHVILIKK
jgi:hypothetical protein